MELVSKNLLIEASMSTGVIASFSRLTNSAMQACFASLQRAITLDPVMPTVLSAIRVASSTIERDIPAFSVPAS